MARRRRIHTFTHDGLTFDVRDTGPLDGPPVVLLHGFPQTSTSWEKVSDLLHDDGYRTLAPDLRGYSPGARPSGRKAYATERLADDVAALLAVVGEPVHLVGHDWGSAIGWVVAARHPDRLLSWTAVSVPHPAAFVASMTRSTQLLKSWYMGFFQLPVVPELVLTRARGVRERVLRHAGMDRDLLERFQTEMVDGGALPGGLGFYRALPFSLGGMKGRVTVPTTLVWSTGDVALGRKGVDLTPQHVDAPYELVVLEGVSHWIPDHAPQVLVDAITRRARAAAA